jgi:hypothetical protein
MWELTEGIILKKKVGDSPVRHFLNHSFLSIILINNCKSSKDG